jgi:hypothetical protein
MFDEYVVEVGGVEVILTLLRNGNLKKGEEPYFKVTSGTDWGGDEVVVPEEDLKIAIDYVKDVYVDEVYG